MPLHHGCTVGCAVQLHGRVCCGPVYINVPADSSIRAALQCHGRLARPPLRPAHRFAPAYNVMDILPVRPRGRLCHPRRLTTPWPSLATAPAYNVVAVSHDRAGLQCCGRLSRPRHTMPWPSLATEPVYNTLAVSRDHMLVNVAEN